MRQGNSKQGRRILGRVTQEEFVGRTAELAQLVSHPAVAGEPRGLLVLLAPLAGVSELLRQTYDELFNRQGEIVPIYFQVERTYATAVSAAIEFLTTFVLQYIAYKRDAPSLCQTSLPLPDLVRLAPPSDHEWIAELVAAYNKERFSDDNKSLVRFCLSAPQRVPPRSGRPFVMIDGVELAAYLNTAVQLDSEMIKTFNRSHLPYALAGLRRQVLEAVHRAGTNFETVDMLRLDRLTEEQARQLIETAAHRQKVSLNEETRDLLAEQFEGSPLFITAFLQAARERNVSPTTYLACEQLYVDDLMGGHLNRHFNSLLEEIAAEPDVRRSLIRVLHESAIGGNRKTPFETWRRLLNAETPALQKVLAQLHMHELLNWDGISVEAGGGPAVWLDYLKMRFRLDVMNEPRATVVAQSIADALKRAPHTMAHHYRRTVNLKLRELLGRFNGQLVPEKLFHYGDFSASYKGADLEEIVRDLDVESQLLRLPQVFHTATCSSFVANIDQFGDKECCVAAHAFDGAIYTAANQVVWLVAELESKLEADRRLTETWLDRLTLFAIHSGFHRTRIWLIAKEGFSLEASELLKQRKAFGSSRQQFALLAERIGEFEPPSLPGKPDEFEIVLPMGDDNELLAASITEQIARRLDFQPEAINQIKTAIVEACINASEHSFSPDRKIYQRFRLESDKLVITISSRGVVPSNLQAQITEQGVKFGELDEASEERRGWGLKLIKTLMDEVEFERVDDGTSLRMTKYLRRTSS